MQIFPLSVRVSAAPTSILNDSKLTTAGIDVAGQGSGVGACQIQLDDLVIAGSTVIATENIVADGQRVCSQLKGAAFVKTERSSSQGAAVSDLSMTRVADSVSLLSSAEASTPGVAVGAEPPRCHHQH